MRPDHVAAPLDCVLCAVVQPDPNPCERGGTEGGVTIGWNEQTLSEHVGDDLPPRRAARSSANDAQRVVARAEHFCGRHRVANRVGDPFIERPREVRSPVVHGEPDEVGAEFAVPVRSPLTLQVWVEQQTVTPLSHSHWPAHPCRRNPLLQRTGRATNDVQMRMR